ncbi:hypothetical protein NEMIN01_0686 [Nematocida minor]|uniref:uncharacterized protein n=1 Tax=Nematocida minor TaxID=1912983 RepID=UPI00221E7A6E|nr:uncharacterized protein NEMIN01_0686 [Nematocida minor]KAI5189823.1 hypothetical protein NEMIN01_0686 [Nematocida minor]
MNTKEVKIKINVEKIFTAIQNISSIDDLLKHSAPKGYIALIDRIFHESIEIESGADNAREKKLILNILSNRIREYFAYRYGKCDMRGLYKALQGKKKEEIREYSISIINALTQPNALIYSPEYGIHRWDDRNIQIEDIDIDDETPTLHPRTCTLKIDCAGFSRLESMLQLTTESMEKELFFHFADLLCTEGKEIDILKKYLPEKEEYHTIDYLYTPFKGGNTLPVDYGLRFIHRNYDELKQLVEEVKAMEGAARSIKQITAKIIDVIPIEDLGIVTSIIHNIDAINNEKKAQKSMLDAIEYMADNSVFLGGKNRSKVLDIHSDLSNFREDYISESRGLKNIIIRTTNGLNKKFGELRDEAQNKSNEYEQTEEEEKSEKELEELEHSINRLKYEMYLLTYEIRKEKSHLDNARLLKADFHCFMKPVQHKHILKKIGKVALRKKIELRVTEIFTIRLTRRKLAYISIVLTVVLITLAILFSGYILDNKIKVGRIISR